MAQVQWLRWSVPQYTKDTAQRAAIHHTGTATEEKSLPPAAGLGWEEGEPAANGDPTAHLDSDRAGWLMSSFGAEFAQGSAFCSSLYCLYEKSLLLLQKLKTLSLCHYTFPALEQNGH